MEVNGRVPETRLSSNGCEQVVHNGDDDDLTPKTSG